MSQRASYEYLKNAVLTAPPEQLQLMLYDGALRFISAGRDALAAKDYEAAFNGFDRAQRIVLQLNAGLRRELNPELVDQMSSLYDFVFRRLVDSNTQRDCSAADDALQVLRHMRETWILMLDKIAQDRAATDPIVQSSPLPQVRHSTDRNAAGASTNSDRKAPGSYPTAGRSVESLSLEG